MKFNKRLERKLADSGSREQQNPVLIQIVMSVSDAYIVSIQKMRTITEEFRRNLEKWNLHDEVDTDPNKPYKIKDFAQKARQYLIGAGACLITEAILGGYLGTRIGWSWWSGALIAVILTLIVKAGLVSICLTNSHQKPLQAERQTRLVLRISLMGFVFICLPLFILGRVVSGVIALMLAPLLSFGLFLAPIVLIFMGASCLALASLYKWSNRLTSDWNRELTNCQQFSGVLFDKLLQLKKNGFDICSVIGEILDACQAKYVPAPMFINSLNQAENNQSKLDRGDFKGELPPLLNQPQTAKSNGGTYA